MEGCRRIYKILGGRHGRLQTEIWKINITTSGKLINTVIRDECNTIKIDNLCKLTHHF